MNIETDMKNENDGEQNRVAYCSWCTELSEHKPLREGLLVRTLHQCDLCNCYTVACSVPHCENMARGAMSQKDLPKAEGVDRDRPEAKGFGQKTWRAIEDPFVDYWDNRLCSEHDGVTPDFTKVKMKIGELDEFVDLIKPRRHNIWKYTKTGLVTVPMAVSTAGTLAAAGPGVAALLGSAGALGAAGTGTAISSLSGAALASASLAKFGLAGMLVLGAIGAGIGGSSGYALTQAYMRDVKGFGFHKKSGISREGNERVVFVNGFLTQSDNETQDWLTGLRGEFDDRPMWHLQWESRSLTRLGLTTLSMVTSSSMKVSGRVLVKVASKKIAQTFGRGGVQGPLIALLSNDWHTAMRKAQETGILLAEAIARSEGKQFTLIGHSLGARVIAYALEALSTKPEAPRVLNAVLMGGAVGADDTDYWDNVASAVSGRVYNCGSRNDLVLRYLYTSANLGMSRPIGVTPISTTADNVVEIDGTDLIDGHNSWKLRLPDVIARLKEHGYDDRAAAL